MRFSEIGVLSQQRRDFSVCMSDAVFPFSFPLHPLFGLFSCAQLAFPFLNKERAKASLHFHLPAKREFLALNLLPSSP